MCVEVRVCVIGVGERCNQPKTNQQKKTKKKQIGKNNQKKIKNKKKQHQNQRII
jgi:hypothetical protein